MRVRSAEASSPLGVVKSICTFLDNVAIKHYKMMHNSMLINDKEILTDMCTV
jgi:hypothetical protein